MASVKHSRIMLRAWRITGLHNDMPHAHTANGQPLDQVTADENHIKDHSRRKIYFSVARLELTNQVFAQQAESL